MKFKLFVLVLISAVALVVTSAYAGSDGARQSDPATQQEGQASGGTTESGAGAGGQMSSDTIMQAQQALNQQGYDAGSADGKFGSKTQDAVKKFQEDKGLQSSGQLDQQTLAALGVSSSGAAAGGAEQEEPVSEPDSMESGAGAGGQDDMSSSPDTMGADSPPSGQSSPSTNEPGSIPGSSGSQ